jgi:hypothetical protein
MKAHSAIKSLYKWEESILTTYKILKSLKKTEDVSAFLTKVISVMTDTLNNKDFEDAYCKIGWCLGTSYLCRAKFSLEKLIESFDIEEYKQLTASLRNFIAMATKYGVNLNHNISFNEILGQCEEFVLKNTIYDETGFKNTYKMISTLIKVAHRMDELVVNNLKYVNNANNDLKIKSPLLNYHNQMKLKLARLYLTFGDLGVRAKHMSISIKKIEHVEGGEEGMAKENENTVLGDRLKESPESHIKYLSKLSRQVDRIGAKEKRRLDHYERALTLCNEVQNLSYLPEDVIIAKIEGFRALRRRNKKIGNLLTAAEKEEEEEQSLDEEGEEEKSRLLSQLFGELKDLKAIVAEGTAACFDFSRNKNPFLLLKRLYLEELEMWAVMPGNTEEGITSLVKYQDNCAMDLFENILNQHSRRTSRVFLLKALLEAQRNTHNFYNQAIIDELVANFKYSLNYRESSAV